jgi:hypothetical protein
MHLFTQRVHYFLAYLYGMLYCLSNSKAVTNKQPIKEPKMKALTLIIVAVIIATAGYVAANKTVATSPAASTISARNAALAQIN